MKDITGREYIYGIAQDKNGAPYLFNIGELVRCGDCKHWYADADTGMACEFTNLGQPEDGYCNWGERKGGEDE